MDGNKVLRPPEQATEKAMGAISGAGREQTARERLLALATKLDREASQIRRLAMTIPEEIHWEADAGLKALLAKSGN